MTSLRIGFWRGLAETRAFLRNGGAVRFNLLLPVILVVLFGTLFKGNVKHTDIPFKLIIVTGMMGSVVVQSGFATLGSAVAAERDDGTLKRLRGMPFSLGSYVVAKTVLLVMLAGVQILIVGAIGVLAFGLQLPSDPARWLTFAWLLALGLLASAMLGIVVGSIIPGARNAATFTNLPFVLLQFVSGIFYPFTSLPHGLQIVGSVFPLKWMAQGMHSVFLPHQILAAEPHHSFQLGEGAIVLAAWTVGGLLLSRFTFHWRSSRRRERGSTPSVVKIGSEPA